MLILSYPYGAIEFCFRDTGFKVWETEFGKIGVDICWDQWLPESARSMALMGAEILFYPTAIGSELLDPEMDRETEGFITQTFDQDDLAKQRSYWGTFRDRRPKLYGNSDP